VISVDIKEADIVADLSNAEGRQLAVSSIIEMSPEGIDGFIPVAGLGPSVTDWRLIISVNFFAVRYMTEQLKDHLVKKQGRVVIVSSNSASLSEYDPALVKAMLDENDEAKARELVQQLEAHTAYGGSKRALTIWMRRRVPDYAKEGVCMNAIAPGATMTPLLEEGLSDEKYGDAIRSFKGPANRFGEPNEIADAILFLLSKQSAYINGAVLFADGGMDALLRPNSF
jgi:NAD(P)-dependent dehydrogenase (short-subunit alcohol dehydrogenase family)